MKRLLVVGLILFAGVYGWHKYTRAHSPENVPDSTQAFDEENPAEPSEFPHESSAGVYPEIEDEVYNSIGHPEEPSPNSIQPQENESEHPKVESDDVGMNDASILEFASHLAPKMEAAMISEPEAKPLFLELENCVSDNAKDVPVAVRAICLNHARVLAEHYPEFGSRFGNLVNNSDPDLLDLIDD